MWRKAVLEPADLVLLHKSETAYHKAVNKNKKVKVKVNNKIKRIGFLGQLSQSMLFNKDFWEFNLSKDIHIYVYELQAEGYSTNKNIMRFNYAKYEAYWYKKILDKVYKDAFNFNLISQKINNDKVDLLIVSIESIGKFTYGRLFDQIITSTRIIVCNPGNYPYFHPKIYGQGQLQLPPCWDINDNILFNNKNYKIDSYKFYPRFSFYDRRDLKLTGNINYNYENTIFIHGRLSKLVNEEYLSIIKELLIDDKTRRFLFIGINDNNALEPIIKFFNKYNLSNQIEYLGNFYMKFNENGKIEHKKWELTKKLLFNSGVFLNPFPRGSGSARMEAFLSGLPVIDFEIDYMDSTQKSKKEYILKSITKFHGTAFSKKEYLELSKKVFVDKKLRENIVKEQYKIAKEFFHEEYFWDKIFKILEE